MGKDTFVSAKPGGRLPTPNLLDTILTGRPSQIPTGSIRIDGATQMRAGLNEETVQEYAEAMASGWGTFPELVVFHDGDVYWLADGFHRLAAFKLANPNTVDTLTVPCQVRSGTRRDAILHAASANADHGLRRTNADKRRSVDVLLRDPEWAQWSDTEIARRCAVSQNFVSSMRRELTQIGFESPTTRMGADGRTYNTANIGAPNTSLPHLKTVVREWIDAKVKAPGQDTLKVRYLSAMADDVEHGGWVDLDRKLPVGYQESKAIEAIRLVVADLDGTATPVLNTPAPTIEDAPLTVVDMSPEWTPSQIERRELVEQGVTVHCNMKTDLALIEWAKERGLFARVDRATEWGNPFLLPEDGDRQTVVENYQWYLDRKPSLLAKLPTLKGKVLGCWCHPEMCHAEVLEEYADDRAD